MSYAERTRRVTLGGSLLGLACILGLVEAMVLPQLPVPGVRLGLANIAVLMTFEALDRRSALIVSLGRVLVVGCATGTLLGPAGILSTAGACAAWAVAALLSSSGARFTVVGWSVGAAAAHAGMQFVAAWYLVGAVFGVRLLGLALVVAGLAGLATGMAAKSLRHRLQHPLSERYLRLPGVDAGGTASAW